jgi:WD40 repeat protein
MNHNILETIAIKFLTLTAILLSIHVAVGQDAAKPELLIQNGHLGSVRSIAFSPNGEMLVSGGDDKTIKLWDAQNGRLIRTLEGHTAAVRSVAFGRDAQIIVSGSEDKTVKVWDAQNGKLLRSLDSSEAVLSVTFSPDGLIFASGGADKAVRLWDTRSGNLIRILEGHGATVSSLAFSPDRRTIASGSFDKTIKQWEVQSGGLIRTFEGHTKEVNSIVFSDDGRLLASAGNDGAKLWSARPGIVPASGWLIQSFEYTGRVKPLIDDRSEAEKGAPTLVRPASPAYAVAFGPDSQTIIEGPRLWDIQSGRLIRLLRGHAGEISSIALGPAKRLVALGGEDYAIRLWELPGGTLVRTLKDYSSTVSDVAISPDGRVIAAVTHRDEWLTKGINAIKLWDARTGRLINSIQGSAGGVASIGFSADGKVLAVGGRDGSLNLWDVQSAGLIRELVPGNPNLLIFSIFSVAFSPDGRTVVSGGREPLMNSDGRVVASGGRASRKLWDVQSGKLIRSFGDAPVVDSYWVRSIAFSPDGRMIVSGDTDKTVKLWDVRSGKLIRKLEGHAGRISAVVLSHDGQIVASASVDGVIKVWDLKSGTLANSIETSPGLHKDPDLGTYVALCFSPDGRTIAARSGKRIGLWEVQSGRLIRMLEQQSDGFGSFAFFPDGRTLAAGSSDTTIKLWSLDAGQLIVSLLALDDGNWISYTPDGYYTGSQGASKYVTWRVGNRVYEFDQFFERFFKPEIVARVIQGEKVEISNSIAKGLSPPPEVTITSPRPGAVLNDQDIAITVEAKDAGGGVDEIRLFQNGKIISDETRQLVRTTVTNKTFQVTLLPGINTFRATAFNKDRTESNPAEIKIELKAVEASSNLYILAIGLNEYKNTRYNLNYGRADAQAVADAVEQRGRGIFKEIKKRVIFDSEATRPNIEAAFNEIIRQAKPQDAFVFYYAGHGVMSESDDKNPADFYLVPYEVVRIYGGDGSLTTNGIGARNLREMLKNVRAQKQLIILDACESGGAVETIAMRGASEEKAIMQLARSAGVAVLASAGQDQVATEFSKLGHGVFTYALLKALSGEADGAPKDGKITIKELEAYINDQVPELTKLYRGKRQDPNSWTRGQDFPIAIR